MSALTCAVAVACAAGSDDESSDAASGDGSGAGGRGGSSAEPGGDGSGVPPEQETEETFRVPVVSGRWVWTANPETGRVALIDTESLAITTADAELEPTYLAALNSASADESAALVINVGTDTVSVLRARGGVIESDSVTVHHGANALKVAPSSEVAIAWTNAVLVTEPDPTEGFQDITVIALGSEPSSARLTVGYRPARVFFQSNEATAFVVSESSISVVDLAGEDAPAVLRDVPLGLSPEEATLARDVSITPDGTFALVRRENSAAIDLIDLSSGEKTRVTLPGPVTDLDLTPDASRAFAVVRGQLSDSDDSAAAGAAGMAGEGGGPGAAGTGGAGGEGGGSGGTTAGAGGAGGEVLPEKSLLVVLPLPGIFSNPADFAVVELEQYVGSIELDESASVGLLYTNAVASDRLTILHLQGSPSEWQQRTVLLKAPIQAVFPAPDGAHAITFLNQAAGSKYPAGYGVVPLSERLPPKVVPTLALPRGIAIAPSPSQHALITVSDEVSINEAHLVRMPALSTEKVLLPSVPLSAGIVPESGRAFVAQRHGEGRITFVDLDDGAPRTLTGFELGEKVDDGSN